jgi:hypothetical protein
VVGRKRILYYAIQFKLFKLLDDVPVSLLSLPLELFPLFTACFSCMVARIPCCTCNPSYPH